AAAVKAGFVNFCVRQKERALRSPPLFMRFPSVLDGYGLDLDLGALGQVLDGEGGAGRAVAGEKGGVDLVHGAEVRDVREQHGGLDDVLEAETGLGEDGADVLEALLCLALDILGGEGAGGGVDGQLAGD